ncbi:MAG: riboflavin synthase [Haloarculaceae archaeon]
MFTGIVEETGRIEAVEDTEGGRRLRISTTFEDLAEGASIAVDGTCLTVEEYEPGEWFSVFLATETVERTTFGEVTEGDGVNLERALAADERFDGHVVQGHVDGTTEITAVEQVGDDWAYTFELPGGLEQYVVEKGSIALDGISLTVARLDDAAGTFSVAIIPTTHELTTLSEKGAGDAVHVEVDVVAKYVERLLESEESDADAAVRRALDERRG